MTHLTWERGWLVLRDAIQASRDAPWAYPWWANVDTASFLDTWIKFGLANAPWIVFPWFVLYWGGRTLRNLSPREGS